ncbi:MAG: glycosyltransferase [Bdellovibrionaceae bacterium]|nr:glycosyltransferase [Pseudobdellovibrionaceae bacterium]
MISAILSSFNEADNPVFWSNLNLLNGRAQILVVDGGSQDGTLVRLEQLKLESTILPGSSRAQRYNHAIEKAKGNLILLVHPRSQLSPQSLDELERVEPRNIWGAFRHSFDRDHPLLRFTSWYSNEVRGKRRSIFYLDHCLFFSADLRAHCRFPEVLLFEDTYFCNQLRG